MSAPRTTLGADPPSFANVNVNGYPGAQRQSKHARTQHSLSMPNSDAGISPEIIWSLRPDLILTIVMLARSAEARKSARGQNLPGVVISTLDVPPSAMLTSNPTSLSLPGYGQPGTTGRSYGEPFGGHASRERSEERRVGTEWRR